MAGDILGAVSIRKTVLLGMAIPMLKIRRPTGRLIFNMGIPIPGKTVFLIETGPWLLASPWHQQQWYWLCMLNGCLSYVRKVFRYMHHFGMASDRNCKYAFMFPSKCYRYMQWLWYQPVWPHTQPSPVIYDCLIYRYIHLPLHICIHIYIFVYTHN